jgi:antitoxin component of MazEF toxin-antitoxin module
MITVTESSDNLEDLLAQVTIENIHPVINSGSPVEKEIW